MESFLAWLVSSRQGSVFKSLRDSAEKSMKKFVLSGFLVFFWTAHSFAASLSAETLLGKFDSEWRNQDIRCPDNNADGEEKRLVLLLADNKSKIQLISSDSSSKEIAISLSLPIADLGQESVQYMLIKTSPDLNTLMELREFLRVDFTKPHADSKVIYQTMCKNFSETSKEIAAVLRHLNSGTSIPPSTIKVPSDEVKEIWEEGNRQ